jgi:general secretion pathway protein E/type IV pilus assembly protein PilB
MIDMGIEPFLVASTVEAVMAQRLVRTLCKECKEPYEPPHDDRRGGARHQGRPDCHDVKGAH